MVLWLSHIYFEYLSMSMCFEMHQRHPVNTYGCQVKHFSLYIFLHRLRSLQKDQGWNIVKSFASICILLTLFHTFYSEYVAAFFGAMHLQRFAQGFESIHTPERLQKRWLAVQPVEEFVKSLSTLSIVKYNNITIYPLYICFVTLWDHITKMHADSIMILLWTCLGV